MKENKQIIQNIFLATICILTFSSCVVKQKLTKEYFSEQRRVGLIVVDNGIQKFKAGGQGLLDMAFTQGKKYLPAIEKAGAQVSVKDSVDLLYTKIFESKNMSITILDEEIDFDQLDHSQKLESNKKYSKYDYSFLKNKYNIDDLLLVEPKYGLLISYQGFVEIYRETLCQLDTQIINLEDNTLEYKDNPYYKIRIKKEWKEAPDYKSFINKIKQTISKCMEKEFANFRSMS